jgi:hypothetical protein
LDEEVERKEQAELARREAVMAELTAAEDAQRLAAQGGEAVVVVAEDDDLEDGAGEVDLDADVPDADAPGEASEGDDERDSDDDEVDDDDEEEEDEENDVASASHFNDESLIEGSLVGGDGLAPGQTQGFLDAEDAELNGRAQDLRDLGGGVDLDADIPEAGSYEHTDTDQDDSVDDDSYDIDIDIDDSADAMDTSFASVRPGRSVRTLARSTGYQQLFRSSAGPADHSFTGYGSSDIGMEDSDNSVLARAGHSGGRVVPRGNAWRESMMRARRGERD